MLNQNKRSFQEDALLEACALASGMKADTHSTRRLAYM